MSDQFPDGPPTPPPGDDGVNLTPSSGATPPPPPPPPPATPGPPPPPPASPGSSVDIGAAFSWAIAKFQQHIAVWIGLAAVVFVLRAVQSLLGSAISNAASNNCVATGGVNGITACETGIFAGIGVSLVLGIVFGALAWLASIGVYRAALKRSEGATPEFSMLTTGENLGPYIVVAIVYGILSAVGLVLCIIPGLIVIFLFQFSPLFALDKGQGVGEAFGNSYNVVMKNLGPVILAALVNIVAAMLGGLIFGILTLITLPFAALFTVHVYRQLNGEAIAAD